MMTTTTLPIPSGIDLEREIEAIEVQSHDAEIRKTIAERVEIANNAQTKFVSHKEAFAASQARLLAKLAK
jgi:hypothetical protein